MELFLDLYGFVSVLLRLAELLARTLLLGSVVFWTLLALPLARVLAPGDAAGLSGIGRRWTRIAAVAAVLITGASLGLNLLALEAATGLSFEALRGADFLRTGLASLGVMLALAGLALGQPQLGPARRSALLAGAAVLLVTSSLGSHAIAREHGRFGLLLASALHQAGAGLWLGGLPALYAALALTPAAAARVGQRYSGFAALGVLLILLGILGFAIGYIGDVPAVYGTAYGAMTATKGLLLLLLLGLGGANWWLLHRAGHQAGQGATGLAKLRRFLECELALGIAVLALAASLTSVPPAIDLPEDRVTWAELTERFTPAWPRLASPAHGDLAIPALQARLDAEAQALAASARPQAFTPGEGVLPPRNAQDIAWSEYNHHWAGICVLLVGLAALLDATGRIAFARHWPLLFMALSAFILVRSDPEIWPLGPIGLGDALRDPEVVQHKLAGLLVAGFALAEWAVRLGRLGGWPRFVLPVSMLAGGVLLLAHTHAISNTKEALLTEWSHLPLAVLSVIAGCARWVELRGPLVLARRARWLWPLCLCLIGGLLLIYREA